MTACVPFQSAVFAALGQGAVQGADVIVHCRHRLVFGMFLAVTKAEINTLRLDRVRRFVFWPTGKPHGRRSRRHAILNWRILREEEIGSYYEKMANNTNVTIHRSWQDCVQRLLVRGLIVAGTGDTEYDALYDLLACRFIVPIGAAWPLRVLSFLKLTFLEGISWKITRRLFHVDARSSCEKKVIRLARQTPLSCAEIIKSIEMDIRRLKDGYDVLDKLYDDNDLNCDNFAQAVRKYRCSREVITAVANLYLRQQIMLDTY